MKRQKDITKLLAGYLDELLPSASDKKELEAVRYDIRSHLRKHSPGIRFRTQGSYRYKTLNRPCHPPQQQMDMDDGAYKPFSSVSGHLGPDVLNNIADCLRPLANTKKWGAPKVMHSCVRIPIGHDKHMDIPFYRVADNEFKDISDSAPSGEHDLAKIYEKWGMRGYIDASAGTVELACSEGWRQSDSGNIIRWVAGCRVRYGDMFIGISRILKGWRDHQWPQKSPLSSISIMAMVEKAMEEARIPANSNESDEKSLREVVNAIADKEIVLRDIKDPDKSVRGSLNAKWTEKQKVECHNRFVALDKVLSAVFGGDGSDSDDIKKLREQFGQFFPDDSSPITRYPLKTVAVASVTVPAAAREGHHAFYTESQGRGDE